MSLKPAVDNPPVYRGATFLDAVTCQDAEGAVVNLTGCTAKMVARNAAGDEVVSLSTSPGQGLVIDGSAGTITRTIADEATAALTPGEYDADLMLTWPDGRVDCLIKGRMVVMDTATAERLAP